MKIQYKSNKLKKRLTEAREMQKAYGVRAKKVNQRMKEFRSSDNLEIMKAIPAADCHPLTGDLKGEWSVEISRNFRILFEPWHDPLPELEDGGLDPTRITAIRILRVEDYH